MKMEAIAQAERLGHRLKKFDRYKDDEVYYSAFCSRCSGYLRVTASGSSGEPIREQCHRECSCGEDLTPDDLDRQCEACRGNRLTLCPKTPAVRAKDASFIEYCRKQRKDYEPGPEELSDYFWRCVHCAKRLGPGYQGDPDERGYCDECIQHEKAWAKRKEAVIEAAGGLKAWQRKKLINKILTPFDFTATIVCLLAGSIAVLAALLWLGMGVVRFVREMLNESGEDWIVLVVLLVSFLWVAVRWKALNAKPPPF